VVIIMAGTKKKKTKKKLNFNAWEDDEDWDEEEEWDDEADF